MRDRSEESRPLKYSFVYFVTTSGSLAIVRGKDNNFQSFIFVRVIYSSLPDKRKAWLSEERSGKDIDHSVHSVNRYEKLWILVSRQPIAILEDIKCENLCKNLRIRVIEESRLELTSPPLQFLYYLKPHISEKAVISDGEIRVWGTRRRRRMNFYSIVPQFTGET